MACIMFVYRIYTILHVCVYVPFDIPFGVCPLKLFHSCIIEYNKLNQHAIQTYTRILQRLTAYTVAQI